MESGHARRDTVERSGRIVARRARRGVKPKGNKQRARMRSWANGQRAHEVLFSGMDEGADDEATESGIRIRVRIGVAVGFFAIVCIFLLPLGTEFGGVHDDRGLFDRLCKRRNRFLARWRKRAFIRMFDYISMRATVARAHDNLIGRAEFARHGVEGMRESGTCHS